MNSYFSLHSKSSNEETIFNIFVPIEICQVKIVIIFEKKNSYLFHYNCCNNAHHQTYMISMFSLLDNQIFHTMLQDINTPVYNISFLKCSFLYFYVCQSSFINIKLRPVRRKSVLFTHLCMILFQYPLSFIYIYIFFFTFDVFILLPIFTFTTSIQRAYKNVDILALLTFIFVSQQIYHRHLFR